MMSTAGSPSIVSIHRGIRRLAVALTFLLAIGGVIWTRPASLPRVPLAGGRELRVLKVSLGTNHVFSTEPLWKQSMRRVVPEVWQKHLGPFQGQRFQSRYESLVIWLGEFNGTNGPARTASFSEPEAVMANDVIGKGRVRQVNGSVVCMEFPWFAREAKRVTLRVRDGIWGDFVTFAVNNPRPARAANWVAPPMPQTNHSRWTEIVLRELRPVDRSDKRASAPFQAYVRARGLGKGRVSWTSYRATAIDRWGNWSESDRPYGAPLHVPPLPDDSISKLLVEGEEFVSAGFVAAPTNGSCLVLAPNLRMEDFGVRLLLLVGPGTYRFTGANATGAVNTTRPIPWETSLKFFNDSAKTNWILEVAAPLPGIICVSDSDAEAPSLRARLRERIGANGGRIFWPVKYTSAKSSQNESKETAGFFALRLPDTSAKLEVEVIALHPPVEFFINPPKP